MERDAEGIAAIQLPGRERAGLPASLVEYGKAVIRLLRTAPRISLIGEGLWAAR